MNTNIDGRKLLKIMAILMLVSGAFAAIGGVIALFGVGLVASFGGPVVLMVIGCILVMAGSAAQLFAGLLGLKGCNDPSKAKGLMLMAIIVAGVSVLANILTSIASESFNFFSLLTGLLVPGAYFYGAFLLSKEGSVPEQPVQQPVYSTAPAQPVQQPVPQYQQPVQPVPPVQPQQAQAPAVTFCPACGSQNEQGTSFCYNCGASLKQ